jgi:hypothetical protein
MKKFTLFKFLFKTYYYGIDDKIQSYDDTFLEKLNYRYTVALLFAIAYLVIVKQTHGASTNVVCFVPAHLKKYSEFINEYCFLSKTYYLSFDKKLLIQAKLNSKNNENYAIRYYQSMQYVIMLMAAFLYLPRLLYRLLSNLCGIDLKTLIDTARLLNAPKSIHRHEQILSYIVQNLDFYLSKNFIQRSYSKNVLKQNHLIKTFFLVKILYVLNSLFIMNVISILLGHSGEMPQDAFFPKVYIFSIL